MRSGDIFVSFTAIFQDVRFAVDYIHTHGDLKKTTVENLDDYVVYDERLATLFDRMHENNTKVFLLTNSGYEYTDVSDAMNSFTTYSTLRISFDECSLFCCCFLLLVV